MTSAQVQSLFAVAGLIGKRKGREGQGILLGFLPGVIGIPVIACMSASEARIAAAQKQYELQTEAARGAGYRSRPSHRRDPGSRFRTGCLRNP